MTHTDPAPRLDADALLGAVLPPPTGSDVGGPGSPYMILAEGTWIPATRGVWRAWTGLRMLWGVPWHGPVFPLGAAEEGVAPWTGRRTCPCATCQSHAVVRPD